EKLPQAAYDTLGVYDGRMRSQALQRTILATYVQTLQHGPLDPARAHEANRKRTERRRRLGLRPAVDRSARVPAGKWRTGVNVQIRQCVGCGKLLMVSLSPLSQRPTMHRPCMIDAMRDLDVRACLRKRRRMRDEGFPVVMINRVHGPTLPLPRSAASSD